MTFPDGKTYVGSVHSKTGRPGGYGIETRADGDRYIGMWKHGKRQGMGVRTWPEGQLYAGEWRNGKMNGVGAFTWPSGLRYLGEWKDHKRHGLGVEMHQDTVTSHYYCGMWSGGKRSGYGERSKREAGQTWSGSFHNGHRARRERTSRTEEQQEQRNGWEAAQKSLEVARKALLNSKQSLEMVGLDQLKRMRQAEDFTSVISIMRAMESSLLDLSMCKISTNKLLETMSEWRRRRQAEIEEIEEMERMDRLGPRIADIVEEQRARVDLKKKEKEMEGEEEEDKDYLLIVKEEKKVGVGEKSSSVVFRVKTQPQMKDVGEGDNVYSGDVRIRLMFGRNGETHKLLCSGHYSFGETIDACRKLYKVTSHQNHFYVTAGLVQGEEVHVELSELTGSQVLAPWDKNKRPVLYVVVSKEKRIEGKIIPTSKDSKKASADAVVVECWPKEAACLFGRLLKKCRQAERMHREEEERTTETLNSFASMSRQSWLASGATVARRLGEV